ncbi:hypothetical protein BGZ65_010784, partial [Modicella reniformis]
MDQIKIIDSSWLHQRPLPPTANPVLEQRLVLAHSHLCNPPTTRTPGRRCKIFFSMDSPLKLPQISKQPNHLKPWHIMPPIPCSTSPLTATTPHAIHSSS